MTMKVLKTFHQTKQRKESFLFVFNSLFLFTFAYILFIAKNNILTKKKALHPNYLKYLTKFVFEILDTSRILTIQCKKVFKLYIVF